MIIETLVAVVLASCSGEYDNGDVDKGEPLPISFDAEVALKTRGTASNLSMIRTKGFDVYAVTQSSRGMLSDSLYFPATSYIYSPQSGVWMGQEQYWPGDGRTLDMYFYAPSGAFSSLNYDENEATFTVSNDVASQVDLLWAKPMTGLSPNGSAVTPQFDHALSRIIASAYIDGDSITAASGGAVVSSVTLSGDFNVSGVFNLAATTASNLWKSTVSSNVSYSPSVITSAITTTDSNNPVSLLRNGQELFIIPVDLSTSKCKVGVTLQASGKTYTLEREVAINFEAGRCYELKIRLTKPVPEVVPGVGIDPSDPDEDNL